MVKHELFFEKPLIILTPIMILMNVGSFLSAISSLIIITYYLSKIKREVVNIDYDGSWMNYIKSIFKR